jgi:hypothetical protein
MNAVRPPVRLTSRILSAGSIVAATILGVSLALDIAGQTEPARLAGVIGVLVLLVTPAAGLIATWWELRPLRPTHAWLAVAVLGVLLLATAIALLPRV